MSENDLPALRPDEITGVNFASKRKGYDPAEVDSHLRLVATSMGEQRAANTRFSADLEAAKQQISELEEQLEAARNYDEATLRERLEETAAERLDAAEAEATKVLDSAREKADAMLSDANEAHAQRTAAAESYADEVRAERLAAIDNEVTETRTERDAALAAAADEADRLVHEAQIYRRQILEDLAKRRGLARRQIEQLRAGRERLIASHDIMRRALDGIGEELNISMSEARLAAETAGHGVKEDSVDELEAEVDTARLSGLLAAEVTMLKSEDSGDSDEVTSDDAESTDSEGGDPATLASVVALSEARADVETGSHPSSGREVSRSGGRPYDGQDEEHDEDLVEDLFARMRSTRATREAGDSDAPPTAADLDPFVEELSRQLKRVLAEEQTDLLATLRADNDISEVNGLLGKRDHHRRRYLEPALSAAEEIRALWDQDSSTGDLVIEATINELVEALRRGVSRCLSADAEDSGEMIDDLAEIYRDVKTERIVTHATTVCEAAADMGARGNLSSV